MAAPPQKLAQYAQPALFGDEAYSKFPTVITDVSEAGSCFALGRYTACVFHLMRVMEAGIRQLGITLSPTIKSDVPWGQIATAVKAEIDKMPRTTTAEKARHEQFAALYARLDSVRLAWRNNVMHPKESYDEEEASELLYSVKTFMKHLAAII
jgi:hypothetical protein